MAPGVATTLFAGITDAAATPPRPDPLPEEGERGSGAEEPRRIAAYAAIAAGVLAFSTSGALAKLCSAPAITIAFWVRLASLLSLVVALWMQNRERTLPLLAGSWRLGLLGGVLFGAHTLTYFWALKLTSVAVVALLGALNPAVVGLVGFLFLGERLTLAQTSWTAVAIAGAGALVVARDAAGATPLVGNLVATVTTILYCGYFLISRHARRGVGTLEYLTAATAANLAVSAVAMVAIPGAVSRRAVA